MPVCMTSPMPTQMEATAPVSPDSDGTVNVAVTDVTGAEVAVYRIPPHPGWVFVPGTPGPGRRGGHGPAQV